MARAGQQMGMAVRVLSALALLLLSFAHQPVIARQIAPHIASQYVLPDGSIGDICFGTEGVDGARHGPSKDGVAPVCDYCRLASALLLPSTPDEVYLVIRRIFEIAARPDFTAVLVEHPHALPQSRAPPVVA